MLRVKYVLKKMGIPYILVSRNNKKGNLTYEDLNGEILKECQLIINTTPLGMTPKVDTFPELDYNGLDSNHFFRTLFLYMRN